MGIIFWIVVTCILAGLEIIIPSLITIWFALAAFVLVAISFVPLIVFSPFMEWKVFIFLSILFLVITRPLNKKYFQNRRQEFRGDYLGKELVIEKVIRTGYYEARFKGSIWTLLSEDSLEVGDKVQIISFEGNRVIVKKKEA
ncbi:MAG: NfeD family protein [Fusobacterium necrophorum]|nr:NfeD family protein [Fusobacterium necrophorum]